MLFFLFIWIKQICENIIQIISASSAFNFNQVRYLTVTMLYALCSLRLHAANEWSSI